MRKDIILSGVGGQGILTIATIIGEAATAEGINLKQAEVHGMSQRGGDVQSNLRSVSYTHLDVYKRQVYINGAVAISSVYASNCICNSA